MTDDQPGDTHFPCMIRPLDGENPDAEVMSVNDVRRTVDGTGYLMHFGAFLVACTEDGLALILPKHMRDTIAAMGPEHDRVLCSWGAKSLANDPTAHARLKAFSLALFPKDLVEPRTPPTTP